jgi:hypothetical protein
MKSKTKISVSNWSEQEKEYAALREEMLKDVAAQEVANAPFVFSERQAITTALTRIDLFRQILEVQGAVVECGVHKGNSLFLYNHLSTILEPYNFNRKIIGFDTFEGFRSISSDDQDKLSEADFSDTNVDLLSSWAGLQDKNRPVSHIEKMELIQGDATKTIPKYVAQNPHLIVAMLYLDFDIYEPTKVALEHLLPLVPKGGIVGLDEINCKKWQGETIALKEVLSINGLRLQKFFYDPWVSYFVVE